MRKLWLTLLLVPGLVAGGGLGEADGRTTGLRLARIGSCAELLAYGQQHALPLVGPYGLWGTDGRRPPRPRSVQFQKTPGRDFSTTNVQEAGVDEPDVVKTDGTHLFAVVNRNLEVVSVRNGLRRVAQVALPPDHEHELLLLGNRLLVLSYRGTRPSWLPGGVRRPSRYLSDTTLTEIDVSRPGRPTVARTLTLTGAYVAARMLKGVVRLVTISSVPNAIAFESPKDWGAGALAAATARNRELLVAAPIADWLPRATFVDARRGRVEERPLVQCRHVWRPADFSGLGLATVTTLDLRDGLELRDADAIFSDAEIVYASHDSLFVATERWRDRPLPGAPMRAPDEARTMLHKFGIGGPVTRYRASGAVEGYLMSQWSLSEHEGVLRVASSERPTWWPWGTVEEDALRGTFVTALAEQAGRLVPVGRVSELGLGERVYAVRFAGAMGYVVTFREVDPLYTIDLSRPTRPVVRGELHIPGYSAYLHPLGPDLMLGVGQDDGMLISLFDVSDPQKPRRIRHRIVASALAAVENDHRAFMYWPPRRLVVVPAHRRDRSGPPSYALGYRVDRGGIERVGRVVHGESDLLRAVVVGDSLFTVSTGGVKENGLRAFAVRDWVAFD